jgi:hypothetical protein
MQDIHPIQRNIEMGCGILIVSSGITPGLQNNSQPLLP